MEFKNLLVKTIKHPKKILIYILSHSGFGRRIDDTKYLQMMYKLYFNSDIDFYNPTNFNEKMQWMKLYCRKPQYTQMADKYGMKEFINKTIGEGHVFPLLGVYDNYDEINFDLLPDSFVIKTTHDSGGVVICKDKSKLNKKKAERIIKRSLGRNYYYIGREWPYKNIRPRVIVEKYITDGLHDSINDYKVYVFNGEAKLIQVDYDRFTNHKRNFYDRKWEYLPFTTCYPTDSKVLCEKPKNLDLMLAISEKIANQPDMPPFLRIDCYSVEGEIYVGEITFFHGGGMETFYPPEWNERLGQMLKLPGLDYEV